ncbi:MAG TPA: 2-phosphosulfolactate phosphatase [Pirellulales bacterium]|nr:2-phosphosulfolactate phosphatase [Pirellulales bacterium]
MPTRLSAHFLPSLIEPGELAGAEVVVIDLLRASTTICQALAAGAAEVIPCLEVDEAHKIAASIGAGRAVLGGERDGVQIEGFDLGNSPDEYTPQTVGGRTVIFTTTNGTPAMLGCRGAERVLIGSFVNCSPICEQLTIDKPIHLICAGTKSKITREDVLCAGAIVDRLLSDGRASGHDLNDEARIACDAWRETINGPETCKLGLSKVLGLTLRETQGGRNLIALGLERDIDAAAQIDKIRLVPELDTTSWRITAAVP